MAASLFIVFFLLRCLANYAVATGIALVVANVVGIWYLPGPAERNIELTLWNVAATLIGALVTLCIEVVYYALHGRDDLIDGLDTRLALIENLMADYAAGRPISAATRARLPQFAMVGAGALRRHIARGSYSQFYRTRMSALVSLVGRSIDFTAALADTYPSLPGLEERAERPTRSIADIRHYHHSYGQPCEAVSEPRPSPGTLLMSEIESMVSLMPSIFSNENAPRSHPRKHRGPARCYAHLHPRRLLQSRTSALHPRRNCGVHALLHPLRVAGLAQPLYLRHHLCAHRAYHHRPSRQKQILRMTGFVLGGVIFGLGSQIFVLPFLDSIGGFAVLFATATFFAAWIGTSSTRLSYTGFPQFAFAFYLIHLSDFSIQTNLTLARDRVLGVLLGITMMWLVFERLLFPAPPPTNMVRIFVANLRLLADLFSSTPRADDRAAIFKIRGQRDAVYRHFGEVNAQSDAVPFETGPLRAVGMAARDRIRRWQALAQHLPARSSAPAVPHLRYDRFEVPVIYRIRG